MRTVESVTKGHPDKVADQISDALLDSYIRKDPHSRVAIETLIKNDQVVLAGEVRSKANLTPQDRRTIANRVLRSLGYAERETLDFVAEQSPEIAGAVDSHELCAGDQGIMYGYATNETRERLPVEQVWARALTDQLTRLREHYVLPWLRPDGKAQVTSRNGKPYKVIVSAQHDDTVTLQQVRDELTPRITSLFDGLGVDAPVSVTVNPAGAWTIGGPDADAGVTGRKLMVDSYGGIGRHGGGAFSGKDPSKVDRSAAYAARQAAKWLVDGGMTSTAEIAVAYAIGVAKPVMLTATGDGGVSDSALRLEVMRRFDFRPEAIIERLSLLNQVYEWTAARGHFGHPEFAWEQVKA